MDGFLVSNLRYLGSELGERWEWKAREGVMERDIVEIGEEGHCEKAQ